MQTPADHAGAAVEVVVQMLVDEQGSVEEVEAAGDDTFNTRAVKAAGDCTFEPATEDGEPVAVRIPMTFVFPEIPVVFDATLVAGGTGQPLADIGVRIGEQQARTDSDGRVQVRGIAPGTYTVELVDALWRLPETTAEIREGERLELDLWARPDRWSNEAVGLYRPDAPPGVHRVLTADEINAVPGSLGDPVRALQNLPGVVRTPFDAGWLLVRGGDSDDTGVYLDGVRIPLLFHLGGHTSVLHPNLIDEVEFHPGTPPARLGHSTSGAANLVPRRLEGQPSATVGVNTGYAHAFAETPLLGGGLAVGARRSYLDGLLGVMFGQEGRDAAPRFSDAALRYDSDAFGLTVLGMTDRALVPTGDGNEVADLQQQAAQAQLRATAEYGDDNVVEARLWYAIEKQAVRTDNRDQALGHWAPGGRIEWRHDGDWKANVGVEAELREFEVEWNELSRGAPVANVNPYGDLIFGDKVRVRVGARGDSLFVPGQLPRLGLSPRGDVTWTVTDSTALVAEIGRYNQAPPLVLAVGMPDGKYLPFDEAESAGVGLRLKGDTLAFDADLWGRTSRFSAFELDRSLGTHLGRAYGAELTTRMLLGPTRGRFIVQLSRTERREDRAAEWSVARFDQPLRLVAMVMHDLPKAWMLSARARYGTGFAYLGSEGQAYDILTGSFVPLSLSNAGRLPPTWSLDAKISKRITWRRVEMDVFLDVLNATWNRVPEPVINGIDNDVAVYTVGLPTLPLFGLEGRFYGM